MADQGAAAGRRVAEAKPLDRLVIEPPADQIVAGRSAVLCRQAVLEEPARGLDQLVEALLALGLPSLVGGRFRHVQTGLSGKLLDRLHERQVVVAHGEPDDIAMGAAAEAVEKPLVVIDREAGGLFLVERATGLVLAAGADQSHAPADHLRYRQAGAQFVEEAGRQGHGRRP